MRIKIYCTREQIADAVLATSFGWAIHSIGRAVPTGNAGRPGEVVVSMRAEIRAAVTS